MSVAGKWNVSMDTPIGNQRFMWDIKQEGGDWSGALDGPTGKAELRDIQVSGDDVSFKTRVASPMGALDVAFQGAVSGRQIRGSCKTSFGSFQFSGERAA